MNPPGAQTLECLLTNGYGCPINFAETISPASSHTAVVSRGIQERIASDSDPRTGICYADYHGNGTRVVVLPVIDPTSRRVIVGFRGFGAFFLNDLPVNGDVHAEFLYSVFVASGP